MVELRQQVCHELRLAPAAQQHPLQQEQRFASAMQALWLWPHHTCTPCFEQVSSKVVPAQHELCTTKFRSLHLGVGPAGVLAGQDEQHVVVRPGHRARRSPTTAIGTAAAAAIAAAATAAAAVAIAVAVAAAGCAAEQTCTAGSAAAATIAIDGAFQGAAAATAAADAAGCLAKLRGLEARNGVADGVGGTLLVGAGRLRCCACRRLQTCSVVRSMSQSQSCSCGVDVQHSGESAPMSCVQLGVERCKA